MLPAAVVFVACIALAVALVVRAVQAPLLAALAPVAPRSRARWLLGVIAAPLGVGAAALALAVGHCVAPRLVGLDDDCRGIAGLGCAFCVLMPTSASGVAWLVALLVALPVLRQFARSARGVWFTRRARERLRAIAAPGPDGVWSVPGAGAFVVGWPDAVVCIGEELTRGLDADAVRAVEAHEDEHRARGDVWLRATTRLLAAAHLPGPRRALLCELDLAVEQACDARASEAVADPLIVAQALIDAARLQGRGADAGCAPASLDARVAALCAPAAAGGVRGLPVVGALVALAAAALLLNHQIHGAAETLTRIVNH